MILHDSSEFEISHVRLVGAVVVCDPRRTTIQGAVVFLRGIRMLWRFLFADRWVAMLTFTRGEACFLAGTRNGGDSGKTCKCGNGPRSRTRSEGT